ncbi:MAG: TMEM175 family protein [Acidimicrobiales bacterium]
MEQAPALGSRDPGYDRDGGDGDNLRRWYRGEEPEFGRFVFFSDAVYAIALTLLVLDVRLDRLVGDVDSPSVLWDALTDAWPSIFSFALGFILLGQYWLAHFDMVGRIRGVDRGLIRWNLLYLGFVAFLPFPTSVLGAYGDNPLAVTFFCIAMSVISGLEAVLFAHARRADLLRIDISDEVFRFGVIGALLPVVEFMLVIPIAFAIAPTGSAAWSLLALAVLAPALGYLVRVRAPEGVEALTGRSYRNRPRQPGTSSGGGA